MYCLRTDKCSCWERRRRESGWTWNEGSFWLSLRLAGSAGKGDANENGNGVRFNAPAGLWFDEKHQSLLVCDFWNS